MAVVGVDFGNLGSTVCVAQNRGIDTILNEVNNRATPSMVGFSDSRQIGEEAMSQYNRNVKNTVANLKRLVGRKYADPMVQRELEWLPFKVVEMEGGYVGVSVMFQGEQRTFSPEAVAGMLFHKLHKMVEKSLKVKVGYSVVACPAYYSDFQRRALMSAYRIGGFEPLAVVNEITAAAYGFGIYQKDLPETGEYRVAFVDIGHSSLQCEIVSFNKQSMKVLATTYDEGIGGRNFDQRLAKHFTEEIKRKYKMDVSENARARVRLLAACEKVKKVLSANPKSPLNVPCLMNDVDVALMIDRTTFEEMSEDLLERVEAPLRGALAQAGIQAEDLDAVEQIGGTVRIPRIQATIKSVFGRDPGRRLSSDECVAKGCAMQCAVLSPKFQVKKSFKVQERLSHPITITYAQQENGSFEGVTEETSEIYTSKDLIPKAKIMTFKTTEQVRIRAEYSPGTCCPDPPGRFLGEFLIASGKPAPEATSVKLKVRLRLNSSMLFTVESATMEEELPPEPVPEPTPAPAPSEGAERKADAEAGENGDAAMPDAAADEEAKKKKAEEWAKKVEEEAKKAASSGKVRVRKTQLEVTSNFVARMGPAEEASLVEEEGKMAAHDQLVIDTAEAKNNLEAFVYDIRGQVKPYGDLRKYLRENVADEYVKNLDATEEWLYEEEAETATKTVFLEKLKALRVTGDRAKSLQFEDSKRPECVSSVQANIDYYVKLADTAEEKYAHIEEEDRAKVRARCQEVQAWLTEKTEAQAKREKYEDPVITVNDLGNKQKELYNYCNPIMSKPKPAPKPEEKKEEEKKDGAQANGEGDKDAQDGGEKKEGAADAAAAGSGGAEKDEAMPDAPAPDAPQPMDVEGGDLD
eukprot:CAMPEP_0119128188 /NCGR_PEP_ID=MMETSP1310-20130426/6436_1 /TAXON_ID=464262 /ORGANISM="Genus nov. species nov., Strain RCC2339" /LENGTH=861 /DNA_ID=CAMNT_0007118499 /DNA_START=116 /DNA_END=2701 /DNA_ORIENTATION=-